MTGKIEASAKPNASALPPQTHKVGCAIRCGEFARAGGEKNSFTVPIGPIHPALKEPIQLTCEIEGEKVVDVDIKMSQVHRGIEWAGTRRNCVQIVYLAERICGICSASHPSAFCIAAEDAANIEVPARADYIRVINAELERIHSHILWAGVAAHEIGFDSLLHLSWKMREHVMDTIEYITGNRVTKAMLMVGGVRRDITEKQAPRIKESMKYYLDNFQKLGDLFLKDPSIKARTQGVGVLTKEDALKLCAVGPTARASGVAKDVRVDYPYMAYGDLDILPITPDLLTGKINGDVYDRVIVRLLEVKQSVEIIQDCLKQMPKGKLMTQENIPALLAQLRAVEGEGIGRCEAPRGEVFHYVKLKANQDEPHFWKVRAPTYNNLLPWIPMLKDAQIADIPIVAASTDPCMACANRSIITDTNKILDTEQLHELSVKKTEEIRNNTQALNSGSARVNFEAATVKGGELLRNDL
ncbi:MAG: nickel-dependent hydrogenase large subunit [archaeon]